MGSVIVQYGSRNTSPNFNVGYTNSNPSVEIDGVWFA